jgi:hypothetical protein
MFLNLDFIATPLKLKVPIPPGLPKKKLWNMKLARFFASAMAQTKTYNENI